MKKTPKTPKTNYYIENLDLAKRLESLVDKIKLEAEREAILNRRANHNNQCIFLKSKFTSKIRTIFVPRGQYVTKHELLAKLWNCSKEQARRFLKKLENQNLVKVERIKDAKNFDLALLITYLPLYNLLQKKFAKSADIRDDRSIIKKTTPKKSKTDTHNTEVLYNNNIQENDAFLHLKKELVSIGVNNLVRDWIVKTYDQDTIQKYLDLLQLQGDKVKNKAGWFLNALRQKYDLTKVESWYRAREEEKRAQEAEKRANLARQQQQEEEERIAKQNRLMVEKWKNTYGQEAEDKLRLEVIKEFETKNKIIYCCLLKQAREAGLNFYDFSKTNPFINGTLYSKILALAKKEFLEQTENPAS